MDGQWLWDHAEKFARWQHPAMGHRARFAVTGSAYIIFIVVIVVKLSFKSTKIGSIIPLMRRVVPYFQHERQLIK